MKATPRSSVRGAVVRPPRRRLSVAVVIDVAESFFRSVAGGAAQYAREVGDWQLYVSESSTELRSNVSKWHGDGVIAAIKDERTAEVLSSLRLPVVAVGAAGADDPAGAIPRVCSDDREIARLAFEHLRERGFVHFGYYDRKPIPTKAWSQARGDAFVACASAAGFTVDRLTARHDPREWKAVRAEMHRWLDTLPKPVGVMICADSHGRNLLESCRTLGLRVPHDVAVVGVDNDELDCELAAPPLSSIAQASRRVGYEAGRLLDRLMRPDHFANIQEPVPQRLVVPPLGVVARASTDTFATSDPAVAAVIAHLREHACLGVGVAELARIANVPAWQLRRRFKECVGHSIRDDIVLARLAEARRLIGTTELPLKQVARRTGFNSVAYMTTMFRRRFGTTPALYRRLERGRFRDAVPVKE